jgi:hypothetical protein
MPTSIVIDTNLLVLLVVGLTNRNYIRQHKRCSEFTEDHYEVLSDTIGQFRELIVTPNTLSEASNLLRQT